jgi:hypothetical protein
MNVCPRINGVPLHRKDRLMKHLITIAVVMVVALVVHGQDTDSAEPQSTQARGAITRYERDVRLAEQAYIVAVKQARIKLKRELEAAKLVAMRSGNLKEANAIQVKIDAIAPDRKTGNAVQLTVSAKQEWVNTNLQVGAGEKVHFKATGQWDTNWGGPTGPDGQSRRFQDLPLSALIGKCGEDGKPFLVGSETEWTADTSGTIYLQINDGSLDDNRGELRVQVQVKPALPEVPAVPSDDADPGDKE